MPEITIITERCVRCGDCLEVCPQSGRSVPSVLERTGEGTVEVRDGSYCIACHTCVEFCRAAAIYIAGSDPGSADRHPDIYPSRPAGRII